MLALGTMLQERYRVIQLLGQGGMGAVYEVLDLRLQIRVALKQLIVDAAFDSTFAHEAQILAALRYPAIPQVSDYFVEPTGQFLVMQLIPGDDLSVIIARQARPFPLARVLRWTDQLLGLLEYLHQQDPPVIHRDIKPQNLKLTESDSIVLLDFGLAKGAALQPRANAARSIFGYTPQYAPLEQIRGEGTDARSDLFALAATVYHLLTNVKPADALRRASELLAQRPDPLLSIGEANPAVPVAVAALITQALALDPALRPVSATAMRRALYQASDMQVTVLPPVAGASHMPFRKAQAARSLPKGTVTFVGIALSTDMLHANAQQLMQLVQQVAVAHGGALIQAQASDAYIVFETAPDALAAALQTQHDWRSRMGMPAFPARIALHTGTAELHEQRYHGAALDRVAHILSSAHQGQILLSQATYELIRDTLPPSVKTRDLGEHRLADLIRPERIVEIVPHDLTTPFPALKTLDQRSHNLPIQPTPLIGRTHEIATVVRMLESKSARLISLIGPGGTGKTRLSLQVAAELAPHFTDGVFFVSLAPVRSPDLVVPAIAQVLGVREASTQLLLDRLKAWLSDRELLLVLDNFEQVVTAAPIITELQRAAPRLKILVTSREVLRLSGEQSFFVPPLALPHPGQPQELDQLTQYEAVQLFIQHAQAVKPDFQVTNANAPAVAEICYRLDGLPLTIELAAARIRLLTPQALLERLSRRLRLLTGGARDLPERHQTLRNTIDWSYELLDPAEQQLFRRLAVFMGGRTLAAAEAVCNADGDLALDMLDGVTSLLDKSLLYEDREAVTLDGEPRFMMLETIWEYAAEHLAASQEHPKLREHHAHYYLALAEQAAPELRGPNQVRWLDQLEREHSNLRAALEWAAATSALTPGARLAVALQRFWELRAHLSEARSWYTALLAGLAQLAPALQLRLLNAAARIAYNQSDYEQAQSFYLQAHDQAQQAADQLALANALNGLGSIARSRGELLQAERHFEQALAIWRAQGEPWDLATGFMNLGMVVRDQSYYQRAGELLEESLRIYRQLGDTRSIALALDHLAVVERNQGNYDRAMRLQEECLALRRALGDKRGMAASLCDTGNIVLDQGDAQRAISLYQESLALFREVGERWGAAIVLGNLGSAHQHIGDLEHALAFHVEGLQIQRAIGDKYGTALTLDELGVLALRQGDAERAYAYLAESLTLCVEINNRHGIWSTLLGLGEVAFLLGDAERAAQIIGAADALRESIGDTMSPANLASYEQMTAAVRTALGDQASDRARAVGRALSIDQAIAMALKKE